MFSAALIRAGLVLIQPPVLLTDFILLSNAVRVSRTVTSGSLSACISHRRYMHFSQRRQIPQAYTPEAGARQI